MIELGFWKRLSEAARKKGEPICVLAPMANVTDAAFRKMIAGKSSHVRADGSVGGPDVMWTEFVSADGLALASEKGREALMRDLLYGETERPIVAQFFTSNPENMEKAVALAVKLGFDGVDINMGCPDRSIEKQGAGAGHIKNPPRAREIIQAAKRGAKKPDGTSIPISVKTRIGYSKDESETWFPEILAEEPAVLTVHCRTRKEMSDVPARWEHVKRAVEIRDRLQKDVPEGSRTLVFGNGDVLDIEDAHKKAEETGADGVMLGRAIFGNPWLFDPSRKLADIPKEEKLKALMEHSDLFEGLLGDIKNFAIMKKHYKAYVSGWDGAKELRAKLMETENAAQVRQIVEAYLKDASA